MTRHAAIVIAAAAIGAAIAGAFAGEDGAAGALMTLCLSGAAAILPGQVWTSWSFAPAIVVPLALAGAGWIAGRRAVAIRRGHDVSFAAGIVLLGVALLSPLCRLSAQLASIHMLQHVILVTLAPLTIALALRGAFDEARLPSPLRLAIGRPALTGTLYGAAIWFWHLPTTYELALLSAPVHLAMIGSLLAVSLLFWTSVVQAPRDDRRTASAALTLLTTLVHTGMLGALLTFSRGLWYPAMAPGALTWGLTPLEDQQIAGLIMWVPMGFVYIAAALGIAAARLLPGAPRAG